MHAEALGGQMKQRWWIQEMLRMVPGAGAGSKEAETRRCDAVDGAQTMTQAAAWIVINHGRGQLGHSA